MIEFDKQGSGVVFMIVPERVYVSPPSLFNPNTRTELNTECVCPLAHMWTLSSFDRYHMWGRPCAQHAGLDCVPCVHVLQYEPWPRISFPVYFFSAQNRFFLQGCSPFKGGKHKPLCPDIVNKFHNIIQCHISDVIWHPKNFKLPVINQCISVTFELLITV